MNAQTIGRIACCVLWQGKAPRGRQDEVVHKPHLHRSFLLFHCPHDTLVIRSSLSDTLSLTTLLWSLPIHRIHRFCTSVLHLFSIRLPCLTHPSPLPALAQLPAPMLALILPCTHLSSHVTRAQLSPTVATPLARSPSPTTVRPRFTTQVLPLPSTRAFSHTLPLTTKVSSPTRSLRMTSHSSLASSSSLSFLTVPMPASTLSMSSSASSIR